MPFTRRSTSCSLAVATAPTLLPPPPTPSLPLLALPLLCLIPVPCLSPLTLPGPGFVSTPTRLSDMTRVICLRSATPDRTSRAPGGPSPRICLWRGLEWLAPFPPVPSGAGTGTSSAEENRLQAPPPGGPFVAQGAETPGKIPLRLSARPTEPAPPSKVPHAAHHDRPPSLSSCRLH